MHQLLLLLAVTSALSCELYPVKNLTATYVQFDYFDISWSVPSTEGPSCVQGYSICLQQENSFEKCITVQDANIHEYSFYRLQSCRQHIVSVAVLGENNAVTEKVSLTVTTAAEPPLDLNVYRKDNDTIVAYWSYVQNTRRSCATQFQLYVCNVHQTKCTITNITVGLIDYYSQDLQWTRDCSAYNVRLEVLDSKQQSVSSLTIHGAPGFIDVPENLRVTKYTVDSFDLEWAIPASMIGCEFYYQVTTTSKIIKYAITNISSNNGSLEKFTEKFVYPCTEYKISVTFGKSTTAKSATATVYTLPENNSILGKASANATDANTVTVEWAAPQGDNGCIAAYIVCWMVKSTIDVDCQNVTNNDYSFTITGLQFQTTYEVSIAALLQNGIEHDKIYLEVIPN